jgi:uncharacterized coiled-coil DUF342 family protein
MTLQSIYDMQSEMLRQMNAFREDITVFHEDIMKLHQDISRVNKKVGGIHSRVDTMYHWMQLDHLN